MAKTAKKAAKKAPAKKAKADAAPKHEIGVDYVADKLDVTPGTARKVLRDHNIAKDGKSYGWPSKAKADEVVKKIEKARAAAAPAEA